MKKLLKVYVIPLIFFYSVVTNANNSVILCDGKQVLGGVEKVVLIDKNITLDAKLDTGASMASLSATDIQIFKRDNKDWVRFSVYSSTKQTQINFEKPLLKYVRIIKRKEEEEEKNIDQMSINEKQHGTRPVVSFMLCVGGQKKLVLVNLINRTQFRYPMLLGSSTLNEFHVLVDVSQKYLNGVKCYRTV